MKRTYHHAEPLGVALCTGATGEAVEVPVFAGILKHPAPDELPALLADPAVLRKYTCEALRRASWHVLRHFPRRWLIDCLRDARLSDSRRDALRFLLGLGTGPAA